MLDGRIPVVVGATGARCLREEEVPALQETVRRELRKIRKRCPSSRVMLMTGLAEGADQLCARAALAEGCGLIASLPMPLPEYEKDFTGEALDTLHELCGLAEEVFAVPETEPHQETRDYRYRQEGIYVAQHCHVLLALWNGTKARPDGCGTAETISFRQHNAYRQRVEENMAVSGGSMIVIHAGCPDSPVDPQNGRTPEVTLYDEEQLHDILARTEQFNREAVKPGIAGKEAGLCGGLEAVIRRMDSVYGKADALSVRHAAHFRKTLAAVSVSATALTMAFLLYDELSLHWMVLVCWVMLACLFLINRLSRKLPSHQKYPEYRLLSEGLRVQSWLFCAGTGTEVRRIMPETWQMRAPWTMYAIAAAGIGPAPEGKHPVREDWISGQKQYHERALDQTREKKRRNDRIQHTVLILTVLSYAAALLFEIIWGGLPGGEPCLPAETLEVVRTVLKVSMGTLSAVTIFSGNYYGKLCLEETINDHQRMIRLFAAADERIGREGETPELLFRLAREELNENASWYAYQSINRPDLGI